MTSRRRHWEEVYETKDPRTVSWFETLPGLSLELVEACASSQDDGIVDVGGGASALVDNLLDRGYRDLTVLDIAASPLKLAQERLGTRADDVSWVVADVTKWAPQRSWRVWHDRAVFHFLDDDADVAAYRSVLETALEPGGWAIIGTFGPDGPRKCSGLEVRRYGAPELEAALGDGFRLTRSLPHEHTTPSEVVQRFHWGILQRV